MGKRISGGSSVLGDDVTHGKAYSRPITYFVVFYFEFL